MGDRLQGDIFVEINTSRDYSTYMEYVTSKIEGFQWIIDNKDVEICVGELISDMLYKYERLRIEMGRKLPYRKRMVEPDVTILTCR